MSSPLDLRVLRPELSLVSTELCSRMSVSLGGVTGRGLKGSVEESRVGRSNFSGLGILESCGLNILTSSSAVSTSS